jgi:hypothetical protein
MKKSNYNFLIIVAMPMITFIVSILLLSLIEQTLSILQSGNNNSITAPDLQHLPHQPAPTIHPKTDRSIPFPGKDKLLAQEEWKAFAHLAFHSTRVFRFLQAESIWEPSQ